MRFKFILPARQITPGPPVGPALGMLGLNAGSFCNQFNKNSIDYKEGTPLQVTIDVLNRGNENYTMTIHSPSIYFFLKKCAFNYNSQLVVTLKQVYEIALFLQTNDPFFKQTSVKALFFSILGTIKSSGLLLHNDLK